MANNDLQSVSKSVKNNMMIGYKMFARYYWKIHTILFIYI